MSIHAQDRKFSSKLEPMRGGVIVSCQAGQGDVLYGPAAMAHMAQAAERGGAAGIRANGADDIAAIRAAVSLPIIGLAKQDWQGLGIRITPTFEAAAAIARAGADLIAVDATRRAADEDRPLPEDLIRLIHEQLGLPVMADVATFEEGIAAADAGADIVATTLSGYTDYSPAQPEPDFDLLARLAGALHPRGVPVIAEGRISTPDQAARVFALGGYAVVVGSMITRPRHITQAYVDAVQKQTHIPPPANSSAPSLIMAVDIGGTKIAAAVFSGERERMPQLLYQTNQPTHAAEGGEAVYARIESLIGGLRESFPDVAAISIGTSGEVDDAGSIVFATDFMPGYAGIELGARLRAATGLPVVVENDGASAALGEATYGVGVGYAPVLSVTVGTGVGGGMALHGKPYLGAHRAALNLGHIPVVRDGRLCTCGRRGCLEAYVSGAALVSAYQQHAKASAPPATGSPEAGVNAAHLPEDKMPDTGEAVSAALAQADPAALAAIEEIGTWLGYGLATAANLLDPAIITLGGGVTASGAPLFEAVRAAFRRYAYPTVQHIPIVQAGLGDAAVLWGAAATARDMLASQSASQPASPTGAAALRVAPARARLR